MLMEPVVLGITPLQQLWQAVECLLAVATLEDGAGVGTGPLIGDKGDMVVAMKWW
jgi:hypothetical protein